MSERGEQLANRTSMHFTVSVGISASVTMRGLMEAIEAELKTRAVDPTAPAPARAHAGGSSEGGGEKRCGWPMGVGNQIRID